MANVDIKKSVLGFAFVAFLLLAVLFGMQIMTFMFGQVGESAVNSYEDETGTNVNQTGAYINATTYTITEASLANFLGGFTVSSALNSTDNSTIAAGNYTVDAAAGTITNATAVVYDSVTLTYSFLRKSAAREATEAVNNNSLQSVETYTNQSGTQMSTVAIAITLVILIALFLLFWNIFIGGNKKQDGGNFS